MFETLHIYMPLTYGLHGWMFGRQHFDPVRHPGSPEGEPLYPSGDAAGV